MKVILLKDLGKLGKEADVVDVKDGYGRNYLIPRGFALKANDNNFKRLQEFQNTKAKTRERKKQGFFGIKEKIDKVSLTIAAEAKDNEELYGTIGLVQILKLLAAEGVEIDKEALLIDEPIKKLGVYNLKVLLHPDVEATFRLWVVKK